MAHLTQTTSTLRTEDVKRLWHLVDVNGKILGRAMTDISKKLMGKHRAEYSPHIDSGDYVVVINAQSVKITGRKAQQKEYTRYSGYPGGLKSLTFEKLMQRDPRKIIENAVAGMLPKNKLQDKRMRRLFVFPADKHPYGDKFTK